MRSWIKSLALMVALCGVALMVRAVTIQSFNGTGANSTTVEHTWDDSGNYTAAGTVTSAASTVSGAQSVGGTLAVTGALTSNGLNVYAPSTYRVTATSTIVPTSNYIWLVSTGDNLYMSGKPVISTATTLGGGTQWADGTWLMIQSASVISSITIQLPNVANASTSRLYFSSSTRASSLTDQNVPWNDRVVYSTSPAVFLIYKSTPNAWFGIQ